jgi:hypothetical protein
LFSRHNSTLAARTPDVGATLAPCGTRLRNFTITEISKYVIKTFL